MLLFFLLYGSKINQNVLKDTGLIIWIMVQFKEVISKVHRVTFESVFNDGLTPEQQSNTVSSNQVPGLVLN